MRYREDIYTMLVGLALVIYGGCQIAFKVGELRRLHTRNKAEQILNRPTATTIPEKER